MTYGGYRCPMLSPCKFDTMSERRDRERQSLPMLQGMSKKADLDHKCRNRMSYKIKKFSTESYPIEILTTIIEHYIKIKYFVKIAS